MLEERGVRAQLDQVRSALAKIDEERAVLKDVEQSLTRWLDLHGQPGLTLPLSGTGRGKSGRNGGPSGKVPLKDAVVNILRNRKGTTMSTDEILEAARSLGASSRSETPGKVVEWIIGEAVKFQRLPIVRVKPHHFKYLESSKQNAGQSPAEEDDTR